MAKMLRVDGVGTKKKEDNANKTFNYKPINKNNMKKLFLIITLAAIMIGFNSCEKENESESKKYTLRVTNTSSNAYTFNLDWRSATIYGNSYYEYEDLWGSYDYDYEQQYGYTFYPTTGSGTVNMTSGDREIVIP